LRNYDNDGKWYIFLDEAHKGDRKESKKDSIFILSSLSGLLTIYGNRVSIKKSGGDEPYL